MSNLESYESDVYEDKQKGFYFVSSIYETISRLDKDSQLKMLKAVLDYGFYDTMPTDLSGMEEILFQSFMTTIIYGKKRSEKCRKNALIRKNKRESNKSVKKEETPKIDANTGEIKEVKKVSVW